MKPNVIMAEIGEYVIVRAARKGFDIYKNTSTHMVRVAQCGYEGKKGLDWCRSDISRRQGETK